jgi:outer membrane biosynthesis protein TonB
LGVAGLALLTVSAPAFAGTDDNAKKVLVCHATSSATNPYVATFISINALSSHRLETADIVAPNSVLTDGHNWTTAGMANFAKYCTATAPVEEKPPTEEEPPAEQPPTEEEPPAEQPPTEEQPPAEQPTTEEQPTAEQPTTEEQPTVEKPAVLTETPVTPAPAAEKPAGQAAVPQRAVAKVPAAVVSRGTNQGYNAQTSVTGTGGSTTWLAGLGVLLGAGAVVSVRRKSRTESPTAG